MRTLFFNQRDELLKIKHDDIVYFQADGNYSKVVLTSSKELLLTMNLSHVQIILYESVGLQSDLFIRVGRSLIIHKACLFSIQILKSKLVLKVPERDCYYELRVSKEALKKLKEYVQNKQNQTIITNIQLRDLQTGKKFPLKNGSNCFGRKSLKSVCDYQIDNDDHQISRLHFNILINIQPNKANFSLYLNDLGSLNGTFLNEIRVAEEEFIQMEAGSKIRAGKSEFVLELNDSEKTEIS